MASRREQTAATVDGRAKEMAREAADCEERLGRLYRLVEDGMTELDEALKGRIATLKATRDAARAALERISSGGRAQLLTQELIDQFSARVRENVTKGEPSFRKAYIGMLLDRVEVDDRQVRLIGRKDTLEQCVMAGGANGGVVRSFVRNWRARKDSNL